MVLLTADAQLLEDDCATRSNSSGMLETSTPCSASALTTLKSSGSNASSCARVVHAYVMQKDKARKNLMVKCDKRGERQRNLKIQTEGVRSIRACM